MHLLIRTDCDTQIFVDPCRLAKMPHINIVFLQCFKQFHTGNIRMHGKNKVAFGITKYEPECPKLLFGPLSCLYDFLCRLLKICPVTDRCRSQSNGDTIHRV